MGTGQNAIDRLLAVTASALVQGIQRYYERNQVFYNLLWTERETRSMNYGLWSDGVRTHHQALANQNRVIAAALELMPEQRVLEAGCGTGGTSIWLARHHAVRTHGITLCRQQAALAQRYAAVRGVGRRTSFGVADFTHAAFRDESFGAVFGSESVCYAEDKAVFLREAFRLLCPGGRLVVVDGFRGAEPLSPHDEAVYRKWLVGWAVPSLATVGEFTEALGAAQFERVRYVDLTDAVAPSSRRIKRIASVAIVVLELARRLGLATRDHVAHAVAGLCQYELLVKRRVCCYGVFTAIKRHRREVLPGP